MHPNTLTLTAMPTMNATFAPLASLLARAMLAFVFLYSGWGKLMAPEGTMAYIAKAGLPLPSVAYAGALLVELVVVSAFLLGYKTRWSAWILCGFTVVSALVFHHNFADKMQLLQFMKNLAIAGGFLQVALSVPPAWTLDHRLQR